MAPRKNTHTGDMATEEKEQKDFIRIVYQQISENARYYDGHIWQIPSVTIAINAFLINQAFSENVQEFLLVRALMVTSAAFFTFVLLIALVKHRLHKNAQDTNIGKIEKYLGLVDGLHKRYDFSKKEDLEEVEKNPDGILRHLAAVGANKWLMYVMLVIFFVDIGILIGILYRYW